MKRRLINLLLLVLLLPILAVSVSATLAVDGLSTKNSGDATWTLNGNSISGEVNAEKTTIVLWSSWSAKSGTLTLTNSSGAEATLKFDLNIISNDGSVTVDGTTYTSSTSIVKENWANGSSFSIVINSGKNENNKTQITLTGITLSKDESYTTTFTKPENGSYTVGGVGVTETTQKTQSGTQGYAVAATAASGYKFLYWYDETNQQILSRNASTTLMVSSDCTISAKFVPKDHAIFQVGAQYFDTLGAACEYAAANSQMLIVLAESGEISETCTIPTGVTLLIPYDAAGTLPDTIEPENAADAVPTAFRTLTMKAGTSVTVSGAIRLGGRYYATSTSYCCQTTGAYGKIDMASGSKITLNGGSALYAWGYITGDGTVTAKSGATVYELLQIADWRGGKTAYGMNGNKNKVFMFSQYYIQNIEAALTIEYGAVEKMFFAVEASSVLANTTATLISSTDGGGLFQLSSGSMTKRYDATNDRMICDVRGDMSIASLNVSISSYKLNSADYVLPLSGHFTVNVKSGTTSLSKDLALLPDSRINIENGATLQIASGVNIYAYDVDDWNSSAVYIHGGGYYKQLEYVAATAGKPKSRNQNGEIANATIDVNGNLMVEGKLYTTTHGASIISSNGTGKAVMVNEVGSDSATTYQVESITAGGSVSLKNTPNFADITVTPAKLCNKDGSYTETANARAGDIYTYCSHHCSGKWVCGVAQVGTSADTKYFTLASAVSGAANGATVTMLHDTTEGTIDMSNLVLDLAGCAVNADLTGSFSGFDTSGGYGEVDGKMVYTTPTGKITGSVDSVNKTYTTAANGDEAAATTNKQAFQRYVAIQNADGETSFHRFNISVTSFRALFNPSDGGRGALHFEALFRGDSAVMGEVKEIGFTLTCAGSKATDTPTTTKPIQKSELFISDAVWDKPLTAASVAEDCAATAYIKFDGSAKGTVTSLPQSIDYITALKTAYYGGMLRLTTDAANEDDAKAIVDKYLSEHETIKTAWDSATALTTNGYVA